MRTEDGYIIRKCLDGDSAAFGILVDKYKGAIYALAYSRLHNFHDAEDVTQEVFVKAYQKLRILRRWDNFHAWLYAITSNLCKDWIRSRSRHPDREFIEDEDPSILEIRSLDSYREKRTRQALDESLHEALDSLPEIHRQVLMLFYLGGMSGKEMAAFLGVSPNTIRQRLYRARAQLKEEMLAMMEGTFKAQRLQASFTIRIVEILKRTRIHAMPRTTGLPWGLSLATGMVLAVLSIGSHINLPDFADASTAPALSSETAVAEVGEITVDILKISQTPIISAREGNSSGESDPSGLQRAFFLAPRAEGGRWTKRADMPKARDSFSTSVVNGKIYVIGGWESGDDPTATVEEYDPATDTWTKKTDMPTPRFELSTCAFDGKIYAIGGVIDPNKGPVTSAVEEYDPATDTWTKRAKMPTPRYSFSTNLVDGMIYAIGGFTKDHWVGPSWVVEAYNPVTNKWTRRANIPTARGRFSTGVVDGKIYVIGGAVALGTAISTVEIYDPVADSWEVGPDMPTARRSLSASAVNGKIYVIGGCTAASVPFSIVEEYNPAFTEVEPRGKLPTKWGEVKSD